MGIKNITYLLGAGASYNAVPVVDATAESMRIMANDLLTVTQMFPTPAWLHH